MKRFALPLVAFALLVVLLAAGLRLDPREVPSPLIGKSVPAFALPRLGGDGATFAPADALRGQPWLFNVWASWCTPCLQEHPLLMDLARTQRVALIGLNYKDRADDALRWLARHGDPYQATLVDADGRAAIDWGVYGVPETFVVDAAGTIRFKHVGPLTDDVLQRQVLPLLQELRR